MIHVSNIYVCTEIKTPSELLYIAEIAKYLKILANEQLSVEGVIIRDRLKLCRYYTYLQSLDVIGIPYKELEETRNVYLTNLADKDIVYAEQTNTEWVFDYDRQGTNATNNIYFKGLMATQAYVSFIALVTVKKVLYGSPKLLTLDFVNADVCFTKNYDKWDILDLWLIYKKTNALESWVTIKLPEIPSALAQLNYEAYVHEIELLGGMRSTVSVKQKLEYYKRRFRKNDIVLFYEKSKRGSKTDNIKSISKCQLARIENATDKQLTITLFFVTETPLSKKKRIESLPEKSRELYSSEDYKKFYEQRMIIDWLDIGVGEYTFQEDYFITDLNCDDSAKLWFTKKDGTEVELELQNADAVYAILCENGISFNKERYEKLYFSKVPSTYIREILER